MIEKLTIPDEDVPGWMQTLREGGFTDTEIDSILSNLNSTYSHEKRKGYIEAELLKMGNEIYERRGTPLSEQEKKDLKEGIESRFR